MKVMNASGKGTNATIRDFPCRVYYRLHLYRDHWHPFGPRPDALLHGSFYPQRSLAVPGNALVLALGGVLLVVDIVEMIDPGLDGRVCLLGLHAVRAQCIVSLHEIKAFRMMIWRLGIRSLTAVSARDIDGD